VVCPPVYAAGLAISPCGAALQSTPTFIFDFIIEAMVSELALVDRIFVLLLPSLLSILCGSYM
jgi:hypothetical protein